MALSLVPSPNSLLAFANCPFSTNLSILIGFSFSKSLQERARTLQEIGKRVGCDGVEDCGFACLPFALFYQASIAGKCAVGQAREGEKKRLIARAACRSWAY